jgi:trehalose/maltose hydrolase-like predicted phosphorylase
VLEKLVSFCTSRDHAISECGREARKTIARASRFDAAIEDHVLAWKHLWRRFDVHIQPADPGFKLNVPMLIRLNMFHLLQAAISVNLFAISRRNCSCNFRSRGGSARLVAMFCQLSIMFRRESAGRIAWVS